MKVWYYLTSGLKRRDFNINLMIKYTESTLICSHNSTFSFSGNLRYRRSYGPNTPELSSYLFVS